jgi:hypothetical protein
MSQSESQDTCTGACPPSLTASNSICNVQTQPDGNLVVYDSNGTVKWASGTQGKGTAPYKSVMQSDGNYVLYDANGNATWASGTQGQGSAPYKLVMKSDCNLVILDANNEIKWTSGTHMDTPNRNAEAAICRSVPNGLNDLNSKINNCTTTTEINRNTNFAANTFKLQKDIQTLTATVGDSLIMGDTMFGQYGYQDVAVEVKERSSELKGKKEKLLKEVDSNEAIIERSNRDFSDVKDTITEPQPKKVLRFIEDYTLAFLSIAYLFMIIAVMYVYISTSELKLVAFGKSFICSILLTIFLFMLLYYLT